MCIRVLILWGQPGHRTIAGNMRLIVHESSRPLLGHASLSKVNVRVGVWLMMIWGGGFFAGCGPLEPIVEQEVSDLQLTADTLRTALRDSQRTIAELRSEIEFRRQELADSQIARAQLDGRIHEAERRLIEARHVIDLQREELTASRVERQRVSQVGAALQNQLKQLQKQLSRIGKSGEHSGEAGGAPANLSLSNIHSSTAHPVNMGPTGQGSDIPRVTGASITTMQGEKVDRATAQDHASSSLSVKPGDTLWSIAQRFHITVQDLKAANGLGDNRIHVGQALWLPSRSASGDSLLDKPE